MKHELNTIWGAERQDWTVNCAWHGWETHEA